MKNPNIWAPFVIDSISGVHQFQFCYECLAPKVDYDPCCGVRSRSQVIVVGIDFTVVLYEDICCSKSRALEATVGMDLRIRGAHIWKDTNWNQYLFRVENNVRPWITLLLLHCPKLVSGHEMYSRSLQHSRLELKVIVPPSQSSLTEVSTIFRGHLQQWCPSFRE